MFPYQDPTGTDSLKRQGALDTYRGKLHARYDTAAKLVNTKFVPIERLSSLKSGAQATIATVPWTAFPRRKETQTPAQVDRDRQLQEEYAEWRVQSSNGKIDNVTFTTEFSAYFQTFADLSFEALVAGIKDVIPTANPTVRELLGVDQKPLPLNADGVVGPATWNLLAQVIDRPGPTTPTLRLGSKGEPVVWLQTRLSWLGLLEGRLDGEFGPKTQAAVIAAQKKYSGAGELFRQNLANNPWNNGQKGIFCMVQSANTLPLLFGLMSHCSIPRSDVPPQSVCGAVGGNCVPNRSSDPNVCVAAQTQVVNGNVISLRDPVGVQIIKLQGIWRISGTQVDINNPQVNQGAWQVTRGRHRAVLKNIPGLTLDGAPITTGSQVAKKLQVGAEVAVAATTDLP